MTFNINIKSIVKNNILFHWLCVPVYVILSVYVIMSVNMHLYDRSIIFVLADYICKIVFLLALHCRTI